MATDPTPPDDLLRLNALIDGELPPAEHAALAARIAAGRDLANAHATLARLKACIVEEAEQAQPAEFALPRRRPLTALALGMAAAAVALLAILIWTVKPQPDGAPSNGIEAAVTLASLPVAPVIPDLTMAGLKLVGSEVERSGQTSVLVAAYRGPRGCRLELRVRPSAADVPPTAGTSRRTWTTGDLAYELVAFGMPSGRFAVVAEAAEAATRAGQVPGTVDRRLREASLKAPPCVG